MRWIAVLFLAVPLAEIAGFILVGDALGVVATLALVVATAIAGLVLFRWQGTGLAARLKVAVDQNQAPVGEMLDGLGLGIAAVLLLIPGFLTDIFGLALMLPALRRAILVVLLVRLRARIVREDGSRPGDRDEDTVVDASFTDVSEPEDAPAPRRIEKDPAGPWQEPPKQNPDRER